MKKSIIRLLFILIALHVFGTLGYMYIEGWNTSDSFYMTLITITTTGYGEVHPLTENGRIFTIVLLTSGVFTVAYSLNNFAQSLLTMDFEAIRRKKMEKRIAKLKNHTVICGYGRMGKVICKELANAGIPFVVLDKDAEIFKDVPSSYMWLAGDVAHDSLLITAGIAQAKNLACMVDNDSDSLYVSLASRSLNPNLYIISRANDESARLKILRAGADRVILPIHISGIKVAQSVLRPEYDDLIDLDGIKLSNSERVHLSEMSVCNKTQLIGKTLSTFQYKDDKIIIIGVRHNDGQFTFRPTSKYEFKEGDTLVTMTAA